MAEKTEPRVRPGSPEDLKLTFENLQAFFAAKLTMMESGIEVEGGTANTHSVCHVDGTTDPN